MARCRKPSTGVFICKNIFTERKNGFEKFALLFYGCGVRERALQMSTKVSRLFLQLPARSNNRFLIRLYQNFGNRSVNLERIAVRRKNKKNRIIAFSEEMGEKGAGVRN